MKPGITFSVVIPTYNRAGTIRRAVDSVIKQTYPPTQIIVVDDGSTDNTVDCLEQYILANQVTVIHQSNLGGAAARNTGVTACTGDYVTFLDSDDVVETNWLQSLATAAINMDADVVFCGYRVRKEAVEYDGGERTVLPSELWYSPSRMVGCFDHAGTFACRRELFQKVGGFLAGLASNQLNEFGIRLTAEIAATRARTTSVLEPLVIYYTGRTDNVRGDADAIVAGTTQLLKIHEMVFRANAREYAHHCTVLGVRLVVLGRSSEGRRYLWRSVKLNPFTLQAWVRVFVACVPLLRQRAWGHLRR